MLILCRFFKPNLLIINTSVNNVNFLSQNIINKKKKNSILYIYIVEKRKIDIVDR
jgi:hypothetical protein